MGKWIRRHAAATMDYLPRWIFAPAIGLGLLAPYRVLYFPLLVNSRGAMSGDYAVVVPNLLAGYFWYLENGVFALPWFSPGECGGVPFFADQAVFWFSLPQFLSFIINPVAALKAGFLAFAFAGYLGAYALVRRSFGGTRAASLVAGVLFMFNGFYSMRTLVGHATFQTFMLMPLLCLAILPAPGRAPAGPAPRVAGTLVFGIVLAVMFQASMFHAIPAVLIGVAMIALMHAAIFGFSWTSAGIAMAGVVLGGCLAIGKMAALAQFVAIFPRTNYSLPGFADFFDELLFIGRALFIRLPEHAQDHLTNLSIAQEQHEFEIGVTAVPLILSAIFVGQRVWQRPRNGIAPRYVVAWFAIACLAAVPMALNFHQANWTALLALGWLGWRFVRRRSCPAPEVRHSIWRT